MSARSTGPGTAAIDGWVTCPLISPPLWLTRKIRPGYPQLRSCAVIRPRTCPASAVAPITAIEAGRNKGARSRRSPLPRLISALGEEGPDAVRALARHQPAKLQRPGALDAVLVAP